MPENTRYKYGYRPAANHIRPGAYIDPRVAASFGQTRPVTVREQGLFQVYKPLWIARNRAWLQQNAPGLIAPALAADNLEQWNSILAPLGVNHGEAEMLSEIKAGRQGISPLNPNTAAPAPAQPTSDPLFQQFKAAWLRRMGGWVQQNNPDMLPKLRAARNLEEWNVAGAAAGMTNIDEAAMKSELKYAQLPVSQHPPLTKSVEPGYEGPPGVRTELPAQMRQAPPSAGGPMTPPYVSIPRMTPPYAPMPPKTPPPTRPVPMPILIDRRHPPNQNPDNKPLPTTWPNMYGPTRPVARRPRRTTSSPREVVGQTNEEFQRKRRAQAAARLRRR